MPTIFPTQALAIATASHAGQQQTDVGFEWEREVENG
jgi:hypothetical protein